MAFTSDITLHNAAEGNQVYSLVSQDNTRSVRKDATRPIGAPMGLTIAHEISKDGTKVNTAVWLERTEIDDESLVIENGKILLKLSYTKGVVLTADDIQELRKELVEFLSAANVTKLLNQEH